MKTAEERAYEISDIAKYPDPHGVRPSRIRRSFESFESDIRKDERQKVADKFKALTIHEVTYSETLYNAILKG